MKKRLCVAAIVVFVIIAAILAFDLLPFAVNVNPFASYGSIGIALDKNEMKQANRIVLSNVDRTVEIEITDQELIQNLVNETMVATLANICHIHERTIEVYHDETLIRAMEWTGCHGGDTVLVYREDEKHPIGMSGYDGQDEGYAQLSADLLAELNAIFESNSPNNP